MTEETKKSDLIRRQDAIDTPEKFTKDCNPEHFVGHQKFIEFMDSDEIRSFGKWQLANGFNMGLTAAELAIKKLPSAQPEQHWIPVSERLPNHDECIKNNGLFNVSDGDRSYSEWFDSDKQKFGEPTMAGFRVDYAVIAWMPLPEPYVEDDYE